MCCDLHINRGEHPIVGVVVIIVMMLNGRLVKRLKRRRVPADLPDFLTFDLSNGPPWPFRLCVREFLNKHAVPLLPSPSPPLVTWLAAFRLGDPSDDASLCLHIIEEDVSTSPRSPYCDHCRIVGWSAHPVCRKRYHFIIKAYGHSVKGSYKPCLCSSELLHSSQSRCKTCNHAMTKEDVQDWAYQHLESTTHLLHGVVHANGFGHLLRVNGREGGSRVLSGRHIMGFWDRLCCILGVRKVSVMDVSKKFGLEYRLLHAIIKGHPWYGEWGYEFGIGSFGLSKDGYDRAVKSLSGLPLSRFDSREGESKTHLQSVVSFYKSLSKQELMSARDLFSLLMRLIHEHHNSFLVAHNVAFHERGSFSDEVLYPCNSTDIERVKAAMIKVLRAVSSLNWVASRALRGAVCRMASPKLLDYCLKDLEGRSTADGLVVSSRCSRQSGSLEYRLEPRNRSSDLTQSCNQYPSASSPSAENLLQDLRYLYLSILHPHTMSNDIPHDLVADAAQKVLDCKQFVKDYKPEKSIQSGRSHSTTFVSCEVELVDQPPSSSTCIPPEMVVLQSNAAVSDLKHQASMAFQDVYLVYRRFQVEEVPNFSGVDDFTQVRLLQGSTQSIRLRGRCFLESGMDKFATERGLENWTVDCSCGAKDDDGERMLACDACGVWQHTKCLDIHDLELVPARFVCRRCLVNWKGEIRAATLGRVRQHHVV